ncbi:MAG: hypothetical protein RQ756_03935, partial [Flavobacteriaceae bacterium]|nr:hypothetical protein [Flavobacteriaceae bacterium]
MLSAEITPWYGGAPGAAHGYDIVISGAETFTGIEFLKVFYKGYAADLEPVSTTEGMQLKARITKKAKTNQQMHADAKEEYGNEYPEALQEQFADDQLAITYSDSQKKYAVIIENTTTKS